MGLKRAVDNDAPAAARLLAAAETLFARNGVETTSIRQITGLAGVNVASVNYHFGSKNDLAEAVFERAMARATTERLLALERICAAADAKGAPPDLAAVVSSFVEPYVGDGNEDQGVLMARFILTHRLAPDDATRRIVDAYLNPLAQAYVKAFQRACPNAGSKELFWRYLLMVSATVLTSAEDRDADRLSALSGGETSINDRAAMRDALVGFIVAGISVEKPASFTSQTLAADTSG